LPALHLSVEVQALPSSQAAVLFACVQPVAGLQASFVQTLLSLQLIAVPLQVPALHLSPDVQALLSLQVFVFGANWHPVAATHESVVQGFLSSHVIGVASQLPVTELHACVSHLLVGVQVFVVSTVQAPSKHELVVQASPSSHVVPSSCLPYWHVLPFTQTVPATRSHVPGVVQATPQQDPPTQWPFVQSPSAEHVAPFAFVHFVPLPFLSVVPAGHTHLFEVQVAPVSHFTPPHVPGAPPAPPVPAPPAPVPPVAAPPVFAPPLPPLPAPPAPTEASTSPPAPVPLSNPFVPPVPGAPLLPSPGWAPLPPPPLSPPVPVFAPPSPLFAPPVSFVDPAAEPSMLALPPVPFFAPPVPCAGTLTPPESEDPHPARSASAHESDKRLPIRVIEAMNHTPRRVAPAH
jgi:hypothetical protein